MVSKKDEFIIDVEEVQPKTTSSQESDFISKTMKPKEDKDKKESKKEEESLEEENKDVQKKKKKIGKKKILFFNLKDRHIKELHEIEETLDKDIEVRKLIQPTTPKEGVIKTKDLLGQGFHYFINLEQKLTDDFFFGWLPHQIKKYIKMIIPIFAMYLVLALNLGPNPTINKAIALFVGISLLWALESLSLIVTALMIPILAVILGLIKDTNPFASFSNPIIYLLLSGLIIAQAFRKHELDRMIAVKVLALSKGKAKRVLFYTMLVTSLLGMWMSNTATIALLIPVILQISSELNGATNKNYTGMLLLAAGYSSAIGGLSTILGGNPNAITAAFLSEIPGKSFDFLDWSMIGFPIAILLFLTAYFVLVRKYGLSNQRINTVTLNKEARITKLNNDQKKILFIFFPTIFLWLFGSRISSFLNLPGDFYRTEIIGLSAAMLLFVFKILDWDDVRRIPWEIFLLVGGGLTLGHVLINSNTASFIATSMFSRLSFLHDAFIVIIIVFVSIVLTNFVNNSSTTIILVPVLIELSELLNMPPTVLAMAAAMATAVAPLTPIAMPSFSLIYGTGEVRRSEMIKTGLVISLFGGIVLAVSLVALYNLFYI